MDKDMSGNEQAASNTARDAWRPGKGGLADEYEYVMVRYPYISPYPSQHDLI